MMILIHNTADHMTYSMILESIEPPWQSIVFLLFGKWTDISRKMNRISCLLFHTSTYSYEILYECDGKKQRFLAA